MRYPFLESLEDIIEEVLHVLSPEYVQEQAIEVRRDLEKQIDAEYELRYLLIDGQTGQLESRQLFETWEEAEKALKQLPTGGNPCLIGTLIVNV